MTRTGTLVQDEGKAKEATIMDLETYETFTADVAEGVGPLSEDDEVEYEEDSSGRHKYTIIGLND